MAAATRGAGADTRREAASGWASLRGSGAASRSARCAPSAEARERGEGGEKGVEPDRRVLLFVDVLTCRQIRNGDAGQRPLLREGRGRQRPAVLRGRKRQRRSNANARSAYVATSKAARRAMRRSHASSTITQLCSRPHHGTTLVYTHTRTRAHTRTHVPEHTHTPRSFGERDAAAEGFGRVARRAASASGACPRLRRLGRDHPPPSLPPR